MLAYRRSVEQANAELEDVIKALLKAVSLIISISSLLTVLFSSIMIKQISTETS